MKYRSEIDGLRAIAVIAVIFFHAGFSLFPGGYVGVDVFFVISGYLIASLIFSEIEKNEFSLLKFYERRIRRIFPALFFIILLTTPLAWFYFLPNELQNYAKSIISILVFSSNFYFFSKSGYFEGVSDYQPLLHTWSLSIEEQFYLFFPIFVIFLYKFFKNYKLTIILILLFSSLMFTQLGGNLKTSYPFIEEKFFFFSQSIFTTFFFPFGRVWEIMFGVTAAIILNRINGQTNIKSNLLSFIGLALIFYSIFYFDNHTPFPSFYTLIPVVGTTLIIFFAQKGTLINILLSNKQLVLIGLISYSAYLIHQPLFVFFSDKLVFSFENYGKLILILFIFVFAFLSWKFVEQPFRKKNFIEKKQIFMIAFVSWFILLLIAVFLAFVDNIHNKKLISQEGKLFLDNYKGEEIIKKLSDESLICAFFDSTYTKSSIDKSCYENNSDKPSILVWGDSHANALVPGLKKIFNNKYFIKNIWSAGCKPNMKITQHLGCDRHNNFAKKIIETSVNEILILAQWNYHSLTNFNEISEFAKKNGVKKIIVVGPTPQRTSSLPLIIAKNNLFKNDYINIGMDKYILAEDKKLKKILTDNENLIYISLIDHFCRNGSCLMFLDKAPKNDNLITYDYGHLSLSGSIYVANNIIEKYL